MRERDCGCDRRAVWRGFIKDGETLMEVEGSCGCGSERDCRSLLLGSHGYEVLSEMASHHRYVTEGITYGSSAVSVVRRMKSLRVGDVIRAW
ncbi:hypothetical protein RYX36_017959 [Vicia faba]